MATSVRPNWYTDEDDTAWDKIKAAFQRDWKQTQHDFGGDQPDLNQHVTDTISQATGAQAIPPGNTPTRDEDDRGSYNEADEPAYRYGFAASRHYADQSEWNDKFESQLRSDWGEKDWDERRDAIRRGWQYHRTHLDASHFKTV